MSDPAANAGADEFSAEQIGAAAMAVLSNNPLFKVGGAEIRGQQYRVFENAPASLVGLFAHGATHGDKDFIIYGEETLSFAETWSRACRFANALSSELGVKKGDKVAIAMRNYPEWCISYMAIVSLGAVVVPLNAWWKTKELEYALKDSGAKTTIVDAKRLDHLSSVKDDLGLRLVLAREEGDGADYRYEDLLAKSDDASPPVVEIDPEDDFCINYTSGSTGDPKGVILTHRGVVSAVLSLGFLGAVLKELRGGTSPFGDNAGVLLNVPLFHVTGSHSIFLLSMVIGRRIAFVYRWDAKEAAELIRKHELTNFVGVPSQSYELVDAAGDKGLPSLLDIGSGGAKRPPDHVRKLKEKFKKANPSSGYGLTETNAIGCVITHAEYAKRPDAAGRAVPPLTDIKIVKDDGEVAAKDEVGEIWIRSPANFRGYLNKPEQTKESLTDEGWFRTGDLGKMDEESYVYIVDRIKDLIIRGGENISCLEVEACAYEYPDIAEATVFSVPCDKLGERVGLVFYPKDSGSVDPEKLRDFMAERLAGFKTPERIWVSPGPLPRLGTAKIDKRTTRSFALQHPPTFSV